MQFWQFHRKPRNRIDTLSNWYERSRPWWLGLLGLSWFILGLLIESGTTGFYFWQVLSCFFAGILVAIRTYFPGVGLFLAWLVAICLMLPPGEIMLFPTLGILIAVFSAAHLGSRVTRRYCAISVPLGSLIAASFIFTHPDSNGLIAPSPISYWFILFMVFLVIGSTWLLGTLGAVRDRYEKRTMEAGMARREVASQKERADLARDMHDVLAHSLSVIVSLADGARLANPDLPESASKSLSNISLVGRDSLTEVRGLLARLRSPGESRTQEFNTIDAITSAFEAAGMNLVIQEQGKPDTVTSPTYKTITHLLRETLTNALRHGDTQQPVFITLRWVQTISLEVRNTLRANQDTREPDNKNLPFTNQHWGIVGMKERVALLDGEITCAPVGQNWVVKVSLPNDSEG